MQPPSQGLTNKSDLLHGKPKRNWLCALGCAVVVLLLCGYPPSKLQQGLLRAAGPLDGENTTTTHLAVVAMMGSSDRQVCSMLDDDNMRTFQG